MKTIFLFLLSAAVYFPSQAQDVFLDTKGVFSFFASTALEDIDATSNHGIGALNVKTKDVFFKVKMESFVFRRSLMQEHFNENYMESEKFPYGNFKGKINEDVDLTKDGTYQVTVSGDFTIHGVTKPRTIPGTIVVKGKSIDVTSTFEVKVADHNITIPTVVSQKIAEVVQVKIHSVMAPQEK